MQRILSVGTDPGLLKSRQAVLASQPEDVDETLRSGTFDLVILSMMLSEEETRRIQASLPAGTRPLVLDKFVWPKDLLHLVAEALG
jgi:hypothetical protein